jgi:hypothetical protein
MIKIMRKRVTQSFLLEEDHKSEARNPCLRRSGSAQAGEIRNNLK